MVGAFLKFNKEERSKDTLGLCVKGNSLTT